MTKENNKLYFYPKEHLSVSSLNSFTNCPFSFYMKYYLGIRAPENEKLILGKQFQELLNAKYLGEDTRAKLQEIAPKSRGVASLLLGKAHDFNEIVSVDEPYKVDLGFGIPIMFVPDLLTKTKIIENKYTTGYYNANMVNGEKQATVYYVGVRKVHGFTPEVYYQIFNTKDKSCELINSPRGPKDIDILMDWIEDRLKQIEKCFLTGQWDAGTHKFCDFPIVCPLQEKYGFQR